MYRRGQEAFEENALCFGCIPTTLRTGTHDLLVGYWKRHLAHLCLSDLGPGVDETADEADDDGRDTAECDWGGEENESADSDWELIEGSDHGVRCGGGNADTPS